MQNLLPWIVTGAALVASLVLFVRLRAQTHAAAANGLAAEKLQGELVATRSQLENAERKQRRSSEERIELRRKWIEGKEPGADEEIHHLTVRAP